MKVKGLWLSKVICILLCAVMCIGTFSSLFLSLESSALSFIRGDVNSDGTVNNTDLAGIIRYLSGWEVETDLTAADYDKNGKINNRDAISLIGKIAG